MSCRSCISMCAAILMAVVGTTTAQAQESPQDFEIVKYGTMHEAIGQKQHQGRVSLIALTKRPHFYGVAALEGLQGEVTIFDGKTTVTSVNAKGQIEPASGSISDKQATMLVGAYVPSWKQSPVTRDISAKEFDDYIESAATKAGFKTTVPFIFAVEGDFSDVRLHVINGACPMHARLTKTELPDELRAYEVEMSKVSGKLVGVFARDAVGKLTHPATKTHVHLLYEDKIAGGEVTAHVEQIGLKAGTVLMLPN